MVRYGEFSAWITSEGREIIEYEPALDNEGRRLSCWIPSEAGKPFEVHWTDHGTNIDSATYIRLDGFTVPGRFLYGEGHAERSSMRVGSNLEKPFLFAKVNEDATAMLDLGHTRDNDVGNIVVKVKLVKRTAERDANPPRRAPHSVQGRRPSGEHCISFGEARESYTQMPRTWAIEPHDKSKPTTHVTFVFRYRSREFLVSQGIMSRGAPLYQGLPSPAPPATPALSTASVPLSPSPSPSPRRPDLNLQYPGMSPSRSGMNLPQSGPNLSRSRASSQHLGLAPQSRGINPQPRSLSSQQPSSSRQYPGITAQRPGSLHQRPAMEARSISLGNPPLYDSQSRADVFQASPNVVQDQRPVSSGLGLQMNTLTVLDETASVILKHRGRLEDTKCIEEKE